MLLIGIDEAGYGPRLGPLCHGCCAIRFQPGASPGAESAAPPNLYKLLKSAIRRCPARDGCITIDDSKKVYGAANGLELLRGGVLSFMNCCTGSTKAGGFASAHASDDLFERILPPEDREQLLADAWGQPPVLAIAPKEAARAEAAEPERKPSRQRVKSTPLPEALDAARLSVLRVGARAMGVREFNARLEALGNKAEVNWFVIAELLRNALALAAPGEPVHAVIDRQGGRKFYLGKISAVLPGAMPWIEKETPRESVYRIEHEGRTIRISFVVEADGETLPVALASMAAKLARELCMERLNAYFRSHAPELKPTAGYYGDASRFLRDTHALRRQLGIGDGSFVRVK